MQISKKKKKCKIDIEYRNISTEVLSSLSTCSIRCTCVDVIQVASFFACLTSVFNFLHTSLGARSWSWTKLLYTQPRLGGRDFHGLVFTNRRTDWIAWHSSIQWHMYAHTHHHCGPVINLSSLVQLIWLKVIALAVSVELEIRPVRMDMRGVCVQTHSVWAVWT